MVFALLAASCSDDDNGGGTPVITAVRSTANADSTFTEGQPGQMVVVEGQNLGGIQKIYVNGQEASFNLNLCTSTHIIFSLPSELEYYGEHASFNNEIVVETNHGSASYTFDVLAPAPSISRYEAEWHTVDGVVRLVPGQQITVYGSNFYRISRVYLTDSVQTVDVKAYEVNRAYNQITVTLPDDIISGWLVVECKSGTDRIAFSAYLPAPEIMDISSEMPVPGSTVTITGRNFLEVQGINVNDEYTIAAGDLTVSADQQSITFTLPRQTANDGFIEVITAGGKARTDLYPTANVFLNWDDKNYTSYWWGESNVTSDDTKYGPKTSLGRYAGVEGVVSSQWWWGVIYCVGGLQAPGIDAGTSADDLELRFECYAAYDLLGSKYKATLGDLEVSEAFDLTDRISGTTPVGQWFTVSVPLTAWSISTYADLLSHWNGNFNINTNPSAEAVSQMLAVYFDNFRIVKSKK